MTLQVSAALNDSVSELLETRCCSLPGMNFEIFIRNTGGKTLTIKNDVMLSSDDTAFRLDTLYPPAPRTVAPGEVISFYGAIDAALWKRFTVIALYDTRGREYCFPISHDESGV